MNKINLSFILKSIIIVAITATADQCKGKQCKRPANLCGSKIKILDPGLGLGKIICAEKGVYKKACKNIHKYNFKCTLTPLEKQQVGKCYHMTCSWEKQDNAKIAWSISGPYYNTIHVDMYPGLDIHPFFEFLLFILVISILLCFSCSGNGGAFATGAFMGSAFSNSGSNYASSSSIG